MPPLGGHTPFGWCRGRGFSFRPPEAQTLHTQPPPPPPPGEQLIPAHPQARHSLSPLHPTPTRRQPPPLSTLVYPPFPLPLAPPIFLALKHEPSFHFGCAANRVRAAAAPRAGHQSLSAFSGGTAQRGKASCVGLSIPVATGWRPHRRQKRSKEPRRLGRRNLRSVSSSLARRPLWLGRGAIQPPVWPPLEREWA